jgi:hypothetical protein
MRIASRHMPKIIRKPPGVLVWVLLAASGAGALYFAVSAPAAAAVAALVLGVGFVFAERAMNREAEPLRRIAAAREGQSICDFARDFDTRAVDTWIVRAVYERIQDQLQYAHPAFPVRASDNLKDDLFLDEDDLDLDLALDVEQRTGRSLDGSRSNPYFGRVKTVRDLVMFFEAQPKRGAA